MLGQGHHSAFIYDRGGRRRLGQITPATRVKWSRERDAISEAEVDVVSPEGDCCTLLGQIAVGRHELVIFRDEERVWEGPITRVDYARNSVSIFASDICWYLNRTIMRNAYDNRYSKKNSRVGLVTVRMANILLAEMARKESQTPPINVLPYLKVTNHDKGAKTSRFSHPYQRTVWEEMDSLAWRAGMDYTTIGRSLIINDVHDIIGRTPILSEAHFSEGMHITAYGAELATRAAVTDSKGHWATTGFVDDFYGEIEILSTLYDVSVQPKDPLKPTKEEIKALGESLAAQARRNLSGRWPVPKVARVPDNSRLDPGAPVTIADLVPGVRVPLRVKMSCIEMQQEQKIDRVSVEQNAEGEDVSVTLSPAPGLEPAWAENIETSGDDIGEGPDA